jgi:hypothetical protein
MTAEHLRFLLSSLFSEWRARVDGRVFADGAVDPEHYIAAPSRVTFVMKEVNEADPGKEWDLCELIWENTKGRTWNNVARWARAVRGARWDDVADVSEEQRRLALRSVAVMNLNKEGGTATTDAGRLRKIAHSAADLLRRQISILDPHLVVCCGGQTGDLAGRLLFDFEAKSWRRVDGHRGVWVGPVVAGRAVVCVPHPQARRSAREMFDGLVAALRVVGADPA